MMSGDLIEIFEDTETIFETSEDLRIKTQDSKENTKLYQSGFKADSREVICDSCNVTVLENTTFSCASKMINDGKVAVLNFANPYEPGGGVKRGAKAQEENLCRCSNLYSCLCSPHIIENYYKWNKENTNYLFSDLVVYSPAVSVIKDDESYNLLEKPFRVDVITCAAPYSFYISDKLKVLLPIFEKRIKNILEVAISNKVEILILGAFGCGAFRNSPQMVAEVFKKVVVEQGYFKYFKKVVFAIKKPSKYDNNYTVFRNVLGDGNEK